MTNKTTGALLVLCVIFLAAACSAQTEIIPTQPDTPVPVEETPTTPPEPTDTAQPGSVILVPSPAVDPSRLADIRSMLLTAAQARGLQMFEQETLDLSQQADSLALVVVIAAEQDLLVQAQSFPQVQFIAIDSAGIAPADNLAVINAETGSENAAFLAGYIAALQDTEYRIGVISTSTPEGQRYREAFLNGVIYFCGTCTPVFPPYQVYPVYVEVSENAGEEAMQQASNDLIARSVTTAHVAPEVQSDAVYQYLGQNGIWIVGTGPPPSGLEGNWIASVLLEPEKQLSEVIDAALDGNSLGGVANELKVGFAGLSQARITHLEEIIAKLQSGEIDPVVNVD